MIRGYKKEDYSELLRLRQKLYFYHSEEDLADEITSNFDGNPYYDEWTIFVYERNNGKLGGFIEVGIASVNDCNRRIKRLENTECWKDAFSRVKEGKGLPLVESWIVDEDLRRQHIGTELMRAAEKWIRGKGCIFILSDTDDFRNVSKLAHEQQGFIYYHIDSEGCHYFYKIF